MDDLAAEVAPCSKGACGHIERCIRMPDTWRCRLVPRCSWPTAGYRDPVHARSVSAGQVLTICRRHRVQGAGRRSRGSPSWPGACASVSMLNMQPMSRARVQQARRWSGVPGRS